MQIECRLSTQGNVIYNWGLRSLRYSKSKRGKTRTEDKKWVSVFEGAGINEEKVDGKWSKEYLNTKGGLHIIGEAWKKDNLMRRIIDIMMEGWECLGKGFACINISKAGDIPSLR